MDDPKSPVVLIVEDDAEIRDLVGEALDSYGYTTMAAANGADALERLRGGARPALILLDLMMPVMDGWEFRRRQLADPGLASIPVVVVSADARSREKAAALGAADHVRKPIELAELARAVERWADAR